ncbi:2-hydroxyacyl-CoA dehydratase [Vreelandella janggokensis]|uniref:2-hydroxyacyl-CoA dehydratase n=1 Tax=Vreelandella janggokensis TaxID=370767 RepID=UPI0028673597|nr:2-hydroxyacyl-CoA dehydratase [Halomonas janggokensis]MDR5887391.1 2-hydroxyacyl-CoA dehydratase [Halomonas janggokensis]
MRYNQVKDLIVWVEAYHGRLSEQYRAKAGAAESERLQMVLNYLADHETRMQAGLRAIFDESHEKRDVLDTWFDDPNDFPQPPQLEQLADKPVGNSIESVMESAVEAHRTLEALYRHRVDRAVIEPEAEFFNALAEGHNAELRRIVAGIEELQGV